MWCHLLLLAPLLAAGLFLVLPWPTALPIALLLAAGTGAIVSLAWRAVRRPVVTGGEALRGSHREAATDLAPDGLVRLRGELWRAEARPSLSDGGRVHVVDVTGARLRVRPWS